MTHFSVAVFTDGTKAVDWELRFKERFIDAADPDWRVTIVDCHI